MYKSMTAAKGRRTGSEQAVDALAVANERLMLALSAVDGGVWDLDTKTHALYLTPLWWHQLGELPTTGSRLSDWLRRVHPDDRERLIVAIGAAGAGQSATVDCEYRVLHRDGGWRAMRCRGHVIPGAKAGRRIVGAQLDVTAQKLAEERLRSVAVHDPLTGLANQLLFRERLAQALRRRDRDRPLAVLFLDLDRFKNVNDSLGHLAGDQLLIAFAGRVAGTLRAEDTFARLGGDEFAILLGAVDGGTQVTQVVDRIRRALKRPFTLTGNEVFVGASIGITLADGSDVVGVEELLREADTAMYRAKAGGKGTYAFFDHEMHTSVSQALQLETDLRHAIDRREFKVYYQPIIALGSGRLVGFEALLRWTSPTRGWVSPTEFIPVAEETGAIVPLGDWVLRKACAQLAAWQTSFPAARKLYVAVNVSGKQFFARDLVSDVADALESTKLPASCLRLEITESTFIDDVERVSALLGRIKAMGVKVALDDFGTGYASLRSVHRLHFDTLKIDRSFVAELEQGATRGIVQAIVALAYELGMTTIAEGVESPEQANLLRSLRCSHVQGFHYARPTDATTISRLLSAHRMAHDVTLPVTDAKLAESSASSLAPIEITCPIQTHQTNPPGTVWLEGTQTEQPLHTRRR
jgi:diguanylate cyclase (GGDEF)-like protein